MHKKQTLEFKTKRSTEIAKKKKYFLVFCAVLLVIGMASMFVLLRTVNFDLDNLFEGREEETTAAESTTTAAPVLKGGANFLVFCVSDYAKDAGDIRFLAVINVDLGNMHIRVCTISPKNLVSVDGNMLTLAEHFNQSKSPEQLRKAVEKFGGITIDKFAYSTDTGFKSAIKSIDKAGSLTLTVEQTINYKDDNFNLFIPAGKQKMKSDMLLNYFRYNGIQSGGLPVQAQTLCSMLDQYLTAANAANSEQLYELLFNAMSQTTDISGFDFNNAKAAIELLTTSKDKLAILVEQDLTRLTVSESSTDKEESTS